MLIRSSIYTALLIFSVSYFITPTTVMADDLTKHEKIEQILEQSGSLDINQYLNEDYYRRFFKAISAKIGSPTSPELEKKVIQAMMEIMDERFPSYQKRLIEAYDETFSETEIDFMLDFYKTPTGQSIARKTPRVMQLIAEGTKSWIVEITPAYSKRIQQIVTAYLDEQKKKGSQSPNG